MGLPPGTYRILSGHPHPSGLRSAPRSLLAFGHFPIPSVSLCSTSPYPFCPFGTFPPDRGSRPFTRGPGRRGHTPGWLLSAFGRFTFSPSPTGFKKNFRVCVGEALGPPARIRTSSVGSANSGAEIEPHQRQISAHPGPQWARIEPQASTPGFARRKFCRTSQECPP